MAKSDFILGSFANRSAWGSRQRHNNKLTRMAWAFTVSAYRREYDIFIAGDLIDSGINSTTAKRYSMIGPVRYADASDSAEAGKKASVGYRIRVTPKRQQR